jgi:hypothetical protein
MEMNNTFCLTDEPFAFRTSSWNSVVDISLCFERQARQPISGFPKSFGADNSEV